MPLHLDLHGLSVMEAKERVLGSIKRAYLDGTHLELRIITGRGNHVASDGSRGKIYQACEGWLALPELKDMIKTIEKEDGYYDLLINCKDLIYRQLKEIVFKNISADDPAACLKIKTDAQAGDVKAQVFLGDAYDNGLLNYPKNPKIATQWFQEAAENGDALAQLEMGVRYFLGKGVRQNDQTAITYFTQAAEQNCPIAESNLGLIYSLGYGLAIDLVKGIAWLKRAAEHGQVESMRRLAGYYNSGCSALQQDLKEAFFWYTKAAEQGDAYSQYNLAVFYYSGRGDTPIDFAEAFRWFQASAIGGDADGMCGVARRYLRGEGTPINLEQALFWIEAAKERGHCDAYVDLAAYYKAQGDDAKNMENLKLGAEQGSLFACCSLLKLREGNTDELLGRICENHVHDIIERVPYEIQLMVAFDLLTKEGSKRTKQQAKEKALTILKSLGENGHSFAYVELANLYASPTFGEPNHKQAFFYAEQGSKMGDLDCLYLVMDAYKNGHGVRKNLVKADAFEQKLLQSNYARIYLERAALNMNERLKNVKETQSIIADLRKALELAEQEQQQKATLDFGSKTGFFDPKLIQEKATELLGYALFCSATKQLQVLSKIDFMREIELAINALIESDQLKYKPARNFLKTLIEPSDQNPFYEVLLTTFLYPKIVVHLKQSANTILESDFSSSSSSSSEAHDQNQAFHWYFEAAKQGDAAAQCHLGTLYEDGNEIQQSDKEAVKWYTLAAEQGHKEAQFNLGSMYEDGRGVVQSDVETVKWYRLSAEQGYKEAQHNLGVIYGSGRGVARNDREAVKWYRLAAEQGLANAQYNLGMMHSLGRGVVQNDREAVKWYRLAAEQGFASAQHNLGGMYSDGRGVIQDRVKAFEWKQKAAKQGWADSQYSLGLSYANGYGVVKDEKLAVVWYEKAALQEHQNAQYNLGWMYMNGCGVTKDENQAFLWYGKAAAQGHQDAQLSLAILRASKSCQGPILFDAQHPAQIKKKKNASPKTYLEAENILRAAPKEIEKFLLHLQCAKLTAVDIKWWRDILEGTLPLPAKSMYDQRIAELPTKFCKQIAKSAMTAIDKKLVSSAELISQGFFASTSLDISDDNQVIFQSEPESSSSSSSRDDAASLPAPGRSKS